MRKELDKNYINEETELQEDEEPNFYDFFGLVRDILEEEQVPLPKFYDFSRILKIPTDVRVFAKELLRAKGEKLNRLGNKRKFKVYCASFFVSYAMIKNDYSKYKSNFKKLIQILKNDDYYIDYRVKIGKFLSTILNDNFHGSLITDALDESKREEFYKIFYKIEITELIENLKLKFKQIFFYHLDTNKILKAFFYVLEKVHGDCEYSGMRFCVTLYYILSNLKNWDSSQMSLDGFLHNIRIVPIITKKTRFEDQDKLLKIQFEDNFKKINEKIDYREFVNTFPNLNLKASNDKLENQMKQLSKVQIIKEQLRTRRWR